MSLNQMLQDMIAEWEMRLAQNTAQGDATGINLCLHALGGFRALQAVNTPTLAGRWAVLTAPARAELSTEARKLQQSAPRLLGQ